MSLKPIPLSKPQSPVEPPNKCSPSPPHSPSSGKSQPLTSTPAIPSLKIPIKREARTTPSPPRITCNFSDRDPSEKSKKDTTVPQNSSEAKKSAKEPDQAKSKVKKEKAKASRKSTKRQQASSSSPTASSHDNQPIQTLKREREDKSDKGPQKKKKAEEPQGIVLDYKDQIRGLACKTTDKYGRSLYNYVIHSINYMYWKPAGIFPSEFINTFENSIYYDGTLSKCPNPKCNNRIQKSSQSKYCSEKCALEVARERIRMRVADYKAGENGYRVPTFTPDNPPLPTRYPVITHFKKDGTPVQHEDKYPTVQSPKDDIVKRMSASIRQKDIVDEYKKKLENRIKFIKAHVKALKTGSPIISPKKVDTENVKVSKVLKDCPLCDKSYPIQSSISHFLACRKRKEAPLKEGNSMSSVVDKRVSCGVEIKIPKKQQSEYPVPMFCKVSKYSCLFHNPDLECFFKKKSENPPYALPVCGFPFDEENYCTLPPSECENHANWYPFLLFTLKQQLCDVSAWIEDMGEKISWLNGCIAQQEVKVEKMKIMKQEMEQKREENEKKK